MSSRFVPLVIAVIFLSFRAFGQGNVGGLDFMSSEKALENTATLTLPQEGFLPFKEDFQLNFEIDIHDCTTFGNILRIISENGHTLDIFYRPGGASSQPYLKLVTDKSAGNIIIPIPSQYLLENQWTDFSIVISKDSGLLTAHCFGEEFEQDLGAVDADEIKMFFGMCNYKGYAIKDIPSFSVRNIGYKSNTLEYLWPLQQAEGEIAYEENHHRHGLALNPNWSAQNHHHWRPVISTETNFHPALIYQQKQNLLNIVGGSNYQVLDLDGKAIIKQTDNPKNNAPVFLAGLKSNIGEAQYMVDIRGSKLSKPSPWFSAKQMNAKEKIDFWHTTLMEDTDRQELISFGGYGWYQYNNSFRRFNASGVDTVQFSGDKISPRYFASAGFLKNNEYLIYGGMGNHSGDQAMGTNVFHDLYKVNLQTQSVEKLWDLPELKADLLNSGNLVMAADSASFYTLVFEANAYEVNIQLANIDIATGAVKIVSDAIKTKFKDTESDIELFYQPQSHKFYAVIVHSDYNDNTAEIEVYQLHGDPIGLADLKKLSPGGFLATSKTVPTKPLTLLGAVIFLVTGVSFGVYRKKSQTSEQPIKKVSSPFLVKMPEGYEAFKMPAIDRPQKNAIYLFGGMKVFSREGEEISAQMTEKLRQLFLTILFFPYAHGRYINSQELAEVMWPMAPKNKSKNNRSISIRRLRLILEACDGIEVIYKSNEWKISFTDGAYCDFEVFTTLKSQLKQCESPKDKIELFQQLYQVVSQGEVVGSIRSEWLEDHMAHIRSHIIEQLISFAEECNNPVWVCEISDMIFKFDNLEEQALDLKVRALMHLNKLVQARNEFDRFSKNYAKLFGEAYNKSFNSIEV